MYIISTMPLKKFVQGDGSIATNFTFATPPPVKFLNPRQISAGTCTPSQLMDTPRWSQVPSPHPSPPAVPPDETLHTLVLYSLMNSPSNVRKPEWRFPGGERGVCGSGPTRHPPNTGVSHPGRGTWPCMYIRPVSTPCKYMLYLCWAMLIAYLRCVLFDESSAKHFAKHCSVQWYSLLIASGSYLLSKQTTGNRTSPCVIQEITYIYRATKIFIFLTNVTVDGLSDTIRNKSVPHTITTRPPRPPCHIQGSMEKTCPRTFKARRLHWLPNVTAGQISDRIWKKNLCLNGGLNPSITIWTSLTTARQTTEDTDRCHKFVQCPVPVGRLVHRGTLHTGGLHLASDMRLSK